MAIAPENREALARLKDIYGKKRAWQPLFDVLRRESELASDPTMRLSNLVELAKIAGERLHRNADAILIWRDVIQEDATVPGALDALEKLAEREKDWATFAYTLETRLGLTHDGTERIKILQKLGTLYAEHLGDVAKSAGAWKRVLEIEPRNGRALRTLRETFLAASDWQGLETLYGDAGDWEGLVEVLGAAADKATDPAAKVALSLRAAELYENQLAEPARAFRAYERVLAADPNNVRAAGALVQIYEKDQKWQRLPALLEVILRSLRKDAPERLSVLQRLRDLTLTELRDTEAALVWALEAYQFAPQDEEVRRALESTAEKGGAWDAVVAAYVARIGASGKKDADAPDAGEVLYLRRRVASISGDKLQHADAAITQLREIVAADPGDTEATSSLEKFYRTAGRWLDLRELYVQRLEHAEDSTARFAILSELAKLEETNFSDAASAATRYRAMLEIDPNDLEALAALDRLAAGAERWEELAEILKRRRELVSDDRVRNEITLRLGVTLSERLNDPTGALDAFSDLLSAVPGHGQAVAALEQLAERYPASSQAAGRLLESAYETSGAFDKLGRVLDARLAATKNEAERRELRLRVAELSSGKLGNAPAAYRALEAAFLDRPNDSDLWDRVASAANAAKQHEALATAYSTAIELGDAQGEGALTTSDVTELSKRTARLYDDVLERPDAAEPFHKRVLVGEPLDEISFRALKDLYTNRERWDDLQVLYRNRIAETVDAEAKLDLLMQVCFLFEEILDDTEKAIRAYQDVLELAPEHDSARRALERLYQRTSRFRDLAALLTGELDRATGAERIDRLMQIGEIYEKQLREPSPAVDHFETVLQEAPTQMRAQDALERLLAEPSQRQRIATILEPLYDAQGGWADLVRILEVQLEDVRDPGSRVALLMRIAELSEQRLHATDRAFNALERAVLAEPSDGHSRAELARIAAARGEERARASVLERAIEASESSQVQSELLLEVANLWNDPIRDSEKAEAAFERLIELDPTDADAVLAASRALQVIHMQRGDHRKLAEDLRRQVRFENDAQVRSRLLVRLGELLEGTLGDAHSAVEVHVQRLEHDPNDVDAMRSLERLHAALGQWNELVAVLRMRDNVTNDENGRREIARDIARILEEKVADRDAAITAYSDMLSSFGPDRETLESLSRLYESTERWSDLSEVLNMEHERLVSSGSDATSVAQNRFRSAELLRTHLSAKDRAIDAYAEVLELAPQHDGAVASLEALMAEGDDSEKIAAARVLLPRYESGSLYDKLLLAFAVLAESDEPMERTRALRRAADVSDTGLNDPSGAFGWMARAVRAGIGEDDLGNLLIEAERLANPVAAGTTTSRFCAMSLRILAMAICRLLRMHASLTSPRLASTTLRSRGTTT
ncbi:MAG: hypothetical protein IPK60_19855 [Sandaracinaceae bacterium]|nr:hypothetical protein [Sandaracinaceae bacterium]